VRAADVCQLQKNTRVDRRCWTERASTSWRDGRILIRPNMRRHRLPSFTLISFSFFPSSFVASPLCTGRRCGLPGTFLLSLLLTSLLSFLSIFLFFQRGTTIPAPPAVLFSFLTKHHKTWPRSKVSRGPSLLREQNTTTLYTTQPAGGASSTSRRAGNASV
jgi:hypothetical protein